MALSAEATQRLAALGISTEADLRVWSEMWKSEGESIFWMFLQNEEDAADEYRRWFPRLQEFAAECRRAVPLPNLATLSPAEREQHRIVLAKMHLFAGAEDNNFLLAQKPWRATILSTTWVGLAAAEAVFGGTDVVILEASERDRWLTEVCPIDDEAFWWYAFVWWTLTERLPAEDESLIRENYPIPQNCFYWVLESGVQWGTLAGRADYELWRWDGLKADYIAHYRSDTY